MGNFGNYRYGLKGTLSGTLNEKQKDVPDFRTASPGVQAKLETRTLGAASAKKNLKLET